MNVFWRCGPDAGFVLQFLYRMGLFAASAPQPKSLPPAIRARKRSHRDKEGAEDPLPTAPAEHPLVELSDLVDPLKARSPAAQKAILDITLTLRSILHGDWWPLAFQIPGLAFCALAKDRALIADDQGLGKTTIALLRILLGAHLPAVVVAPAAVSHKWKKEIGWWMPTVPVVMLDGVYAEIPENFAGIVVVTWDLMPKHLGPLIDLKPRIVVGDEVQKAVNKDAERSAAFDVLVGVAPHLLILSGTPITNDAQELWRLLNLIDPKAWPEVTKRAFKELNKDAFDPGVQTAIARRVRQFMLRRLKEQAMPFLKAKQVEIVPVELSPAAMREYKRIEDDFTRWLRAKVGREVEAEGLEWESKKWVREVDRRTEASLSAAGLAMGSHLRKFVGRVKVPFAVNWIMEKVRENEPVVGFTHHGIVTLAIARALTERGIRVGVYDGSKSAKKRAQLEASFQDGSLDVLLCSMAGSAGITLTRGRYVLVIERQWTAATEDQEVDRLHRIGQTRDVMVLKLCANGTIDERFEAVTTRKRGISRRTVDVARELG